LYDISYTLDERVVGAFDDVVEGTIDALEAEEFGVLCDIDIQATFAKKLDAEFRQYRILGPVPATGEAGARNRDTVGRAAPLQRGRLGDRRRRRRPGETALHRGKPDLDEIAVDVRERFERVLSEVSD
jgi:hypothetical protein